MAAILKEVLNVTFAWENERAPRGHYEWWTDIGSPGGDRFSSGFVTREAAESETPTRVTSKWRDAQAHGHSVFWVRQMHLYITSDRELTSDDVHALLNETSNRRRLRLEKAHALQAMTSELDKKNKRVPLSQEVKVLVWQRDQGRCAECESQTSLEFDHVIPLAMGGSNTMRNLQLLCESCNRRKGASLG